jgi:cytochrome b6-f complex iron-sulfur subunit
MSGKGDGARGERVSRRAYLKMLGWVGLGLSGVISLAGNMLYLRPAVDYGPASRFRAGRPEEYKTGIKQRFDEARVVVVREKQGFAAISLVCTHLGCTVRASDAGFECPCHGSQFDSEGFATGGPAPKPLPWFQVSLAPNGELEVDTSVKVRPQTYFRV